MSMRLIGFIVMVVLSAGRCLAVTFVWDNSSGDNEWTNSMNWTNKAGLPGSADTVRFNDTTTGVCRIGSSVTVDTLNINHTKAGVVDFNIPPGVTLVTKTYQQGYDSTNIDNRVIMRGGGTFAPTGDVILAYKSAVAIAYITKASLVVSNVVFDSTYLNNLWVSYNGHNIGAMTGTLDLANATLVWQGSTNKLVTKATLAVGFDITGGRSLGTLLFPGALTNITVGNTLILGGFGLGRTTNSIYFGFNSAIRSINVGSNLTIRNGIFSYNQGGVTSTGFPAQVDLTIGSPNYYAAFYAGWYYGTYSPVVLTNFSSFKAWLSDLVICKVDNLAAGSSYAELDLSEASVTNLAGSITPSSLSVSNIMIGGTAADTEAKLRLPSTLTNIWCNSFDMGRMEGLRKGTNTIFFGANSNPIVFTAASKFWVGAADFLYVTGGTVTNNAFPPGSTLRIGSSADRAGVRLGLISGQNANGQFGKGFSSITIYATNMTMGLVGSTFNLHYVTNDFRDATQLLWDVQGNIEIGRNIADNIYTYLPANGAVVCSNLIMGQTGPAGTVYRSLLVLSNTTFSVSNTVTIMETAIVTNHVNGISSGFDIGTTNLSIQDPQATNVYADYGRLAIRFTSDPLNLNQAYWGLRIKGNAIGVIQGLTNTVPQRLSWTTGGLSQKVMARFGVHYDDVRDVTYVGVRPLLAGTILRVY